MNILLHIIKLQIKGWSKDPSIQLTSDVGEPEALGLPGAVGLRVEVEPNTPSGGDKGRRQDGATQPGFPIPRWSQQKPISQTASRLRQVEVTETMAEHRSSNQVLPPHRQPCVYSMSEGLYLMVMTSP